MRTTFEEIMRTKAGSKQRASIEQQMMKKSDAAKPESVKLPSALPPLIECVPTGDPVRPNFFERETEDEKKLNKTEKAWLAELRKMKYPAIGIHAITLKLGSDCRF
jgi:hypothetical protein